MAGALWILFVLVGITSSQEYEYKGCYIDSLFSRALPKLAYQDNQNTIERCVKVCRKTDNKYTYAGLQHKNQCFCGDENYNKYGSGGRCNQKCSGNKTQICGGNWRNSVYRIILRPTTTTQKSAATTRPATTIQSPSLKKASTTPPPKSTISSTTKHILTLPTTASIPLKTPEKISATPMTTNVSTTARSTRPTLTTAQTTSNNTAEFGTHPENSTLCAVLTTQRATSEQQADKTTPGVFIGIPVGATAGLIGAAVVIVILHKRGVCKKNTTQREDNDFKNPAYTPSTREGLPDEEFAINPRQAPGPLSNENNQISSQTSRNNQEYAEVHKPGAPGTAAKLPEYCNTVAEQDEHMYENQFLHSSEACTNSSIVNQSQVAYHQAEPVYSLAQPISDDLTIVENDLYES